MGKPGFFNPKYSYQFINNGALLVEKGCKNIRPTDHNDYRIKENTDMVMDI